MDNCWAGGHLPDNASGVQLGQLTRIHRRRPSAFRRPPAVGTRLLRADLSAAAAARTRHPCGRQET